MCPLGIPRQQLSYLAQEEEVVPGRKTEYSLQGGFVGTPQYWQSVEQFGREQPAVKEFFSQFGKESAFELFEIQGVFLSLVGDEDIRKISKDIFQKFADLLWGIYYPGK